MLSLGFVVVVLVLKRLGSLLLILIEQDKISMKFTMSPSLNSIRSQIKLNGELIASPA